MEKYIVINLNQAESAETRIERIRERVRWGIFGTFIVLLIAANGQVLMVSRGYDKVIDQKKSEIKRIKQEIKDLRAKGKNLSKEDIMSLAKLEQDRFLWARNMELLGEMTPEDMAITGMKFKHNKLMVSGIANVYKDRKDFEIIDNYVNTLRNNKEFSENFNPIKFQGHSRSNARGQEVMNFDVIATAKKPMKNKKRRRKS